MPRPRFERLAAGQRAAIVDAAVAEFVAHGYSGASLNRIIDAAGISKGSMYYYFDDKQDLYAHVLRAEIVGLLERTEPVAVAGSADPDEFWGALTRGYLGLLRAMRESPNAGALLRGWLSGSGAPALGAAQREAENDLMPWVLDTLATGQRIGAIRDDLAPELLTAVAMGLGQAIDVWLITMPPADSELDRIVSDVIGILRRALEPLSRS